MEENSEIKLCVIIPTYNHPLHILEWLNYSYDSFVKNGIDVHIYDSSNNEETKKIYNSKKWLNVYYHYYLNKDSVPDEKVYFAFQSLCNEYDYFCLCGDGTLLELDKMIDNFENNFEVVHYCSTDLNINNMNFNNKCLYYNSGPEFASAFMHSLTLYGSTICSKKLVKSFLNLNFEKYKMSGFYPQFAYLEVLTKESKIKVQLGDYYKASNQKQIHDSGSYTSGKLFDLWIDNWINLVNNLPVEYNDVKEKIMKTESKGCFSIKGMFKVRKYGILTLKSFIKYKKKFRIILNYPNFFVFLISITPKFIINFLYKIRKLQKAKIEKS